MTTVLDRRHNASDNTLVRVLLYEFKTANDYYPGGMVMPGRSYSIANINYRYGFNGKEKDSESAVQYDYGFRIYDPRLVRFKSIDPLTRHFAELTPYQFASNSPVSNIDIDGLESGKKIDLSGRTLLMINTKSQNIQLARKSFETMNLQVDKLGVQQKFITEERKYFSKFATLANAFGIGDMHALDQNPILSVSKTTITSKVTVSDFGEFGKYLNIERTEEEIFVDISGGGLRGLKSITKTTKHSNVWLKVKSEDLANNTFEVFSSTNGTSSSHDKPKIDQIKLGSNEQESLRKLPNDLAETVKDDLDKNSQMVIDGLKSINKSIKNLEDKANKGDYLPKK